MVLPIWGATRLSDEGPINWTYYTPERFKTAIAQRKTVVMDFTAEWCLNCKVLEEGVLNDRRIINLLAREHIVPMKVDITGNNPASLFPCWLFLRRTATRSLKATFTRWIRCWVLWRKRLAARNLLRGISSFVFIRYNLT
jgi:hypothetical protein